MQVALDSEGNHFFCNTLGFLCLGNRGLYTLVLKQGSYQASKQRLPLISGPTKQSSIYFMTHRR
jgi:hypothetical protein